MYSILAHISLVDLSQYFFSYPTFSSGAFWNGTATSFFTASSSKSCGM